MHSKSVNPVCAFRDLNQAVRILSTWSHAGCVAQAVTPGGAFLLCILISIDAGSAVLNRAIGVSAALSPYRHRLAGAKLHMGPLP